MVMAFASGCVNAGGSSSPAGSTADGSDVGRALDVAQERIGVDLSRYGEVVKSYCSEGEADPAAYIELAIADDEAAAELEAIASGKLGTMDLKYEPVPPLSGHEIRRDLDAMSVSRGYSHIMSGTKGQSISVYMVFAEDGGKQYLFYIG